MACDAHRTLRPEPHHIPSEFTITSVLENAHYTGIALSRRRAGRPIEQADCQIAEICRSRGTALATRNFRDFEDIGIEIISPWMVI